MAAEGAAGMYERRRGLSASSAGTCCERDRGEVDAGVGGGGAVGVAAGGAGGVASAGAERLSGAAGDFADGRGVGAAEGGWWAWAARAASSSARWLANVFCEVNTLRTAGVVLLFETISPSATPFHNRPPPRLIK